MKTKEETHEYGERGHANGWCEKKMQWTDEALWQLLEKAW